MRTYDVKIRNRGLLALFAVASLMLVTASPSFAARTLKGSGAGVGVEDGGEVQGSCDPLGTPLMGTLPNDRFELGHNATWVGLSSSGDTTAIYNGHHTVEIFVTKHVIAPEGTYLTCFVALPIPVTSWHISVDAPGPLATSAGDINCSGTSGTYQRRLGDAVSFTLNGQCNVKGNVAPFTAQIPNTATTIAIEGEMHPCIPALDPSDPPPAVTTCLVDPYAGSNLETTFQAVGASQ